HIRDRVAGQSCRGGPSSTCPRLLSLLMARGRSDPRLRQSELCGPELSPLRERSFQSVLQCERTVPVAAVCSAAERAKFLGNRNAPALAVWERASAARSWVAPAWAALARLP